MKKLKQTVLKLSHCWIYANNFNYLKKITVKIMYFFLHFLFDTGYSKTFYH